MEPFKAPLFYKYRNLVPYAESAFWMDVDYAIARGIATYHDYGR